LSFVIIKSQVMIVSPQSLVNTLGSGNMDFALGNFGMIPYGKTIVGYVFYNKDLNGNNGWCHYDDTYTPGNVGYDPDGEYSPIYLVDENSDCRLTIKANYVKGRGGRVMLLVRNSDNWADLNTNFDDPYSANLDIPTVIISKTDGKRIKDTLATTQVVLNIKFTGVKSEGNLFIDLFLRSDDIKSLHFFKEFASYYKKIKHITEFTPYYKYVKGNYEGITETSESISSSTSSAPCTKTGKFCANANLNLGVSNPRVILLENIRQSCVFKKGDATGHRTYWNYMINFATNCADPNQPLFTEQCAIDQLSYTGFDLPEINSCMKELVTSEGKIEDDTTKYSAFRVYAFPQLYLNGVRFQGNWYGKFIFSDICTGFINDDSICATPDPEKLTQSKESGLGVGSVLLIIFIICLAMIVLLICYKRVVNKSLEQSLNEKIQTQTIHSLGQYHVFKDESTGRKTIDSTKL